MSANLDTIDDDVLICVFSFLSVPEILYMRQVSYGRQLGPLISFRDDHS
jgi:hypothetical protein